MKKILLAILLIPLVASIICSCDDDETKTNWEKYADWRNENNKYIADKGRLETPDGKAYYQRIVPDWNPAMYILIHYFNDRKLTEGNLVPLSTSIVDVKYKGMLITDVPFDSSYTNVTYGDSIYRTPINNVIEGWKIALQNMHVGDSCEVIIPYQAGYSYSGSGTILPYSTLVFGIKLVDIPYYEIRQ